MTVRIQTDDFDVSAEIAALRRGNPRIGAVASFIGVVRDVNEGDAVGGLTLEHYPGMTEKAIGEIVDQACARWSVIDALVIHRVGALKPQDQIVLVVVASGSDRAIVCGGASVVVTARRPSDEVTVGAEVGARPLPMGTSSQSTAIPRTQPIAPVVTSRPRPMATGGSLSTQACCPSSDGCRQVRSWAGIGAGP